jgi:L-serine dehydratase
MEITGLSVGGGMIRIVALNQFQLQLSGEQPALLILHQDRRGVIAAVASCLSQQGVNISHMEVSRLEKGQHALMVIETDQAIEDNTFQDIKSQQHVVKVVRLKE